MHLLAASVLDIASRRIVGFALGEHHDAQLAYGALAMAVTVRGGRVPGVILHTDQGSEVHLWRVRRFCSAHGITTSVGRTGVCWDNAAAESFFGALKNEMYHRQSFPDRARARFAIADYIKVFYNRRRLHSTLGYRTPLEALTQFKTAATAA